MRAQTAPAAVRRHRKSQQARQQRLRANYDSAAAAETAPEKTVSFFEEPGDGASPRTTSSSRGAAAAVSRHLVVLTCRMALPDTLNAEELRKAVLELFGIVDVQVAATGGHVAQRHADGCDIYFGFPSPVDKPVECGCATALGIVGGLARAQARVRTTNSAAAATPSSTTAVSTRDWPNARSKSA